MAPRLTTTLSLLSLLVVVGAFRLIAAEPDRVAPLPEGWDYAGPMKKVAANFRGQEGVVLHVGGSMTIANPYGTWGAAARARQPRTRPF